MQSERASPPSSAPNPPPPSSHPPSHSHNPHSHCSRLHSPPQRSCKGDQPVGLAGGGAAAAAGGGEARAQSRPEQGDHFVAGECTLPTATELSTDDHLMAADEGDHFVAGAPPTAFHFLLQPSTAFHGPSPLAAGLRRRAGEAQGAPRARPARLLLKGVPHVARGGRGAQGGAGGRHARARRRRSARRGIEPSMAFDSLPPTFDGLRLPPTDLPPTFDGLPLTSH